LKPDHAGRAAHGERLLDVIELRTHFATDHGIVRSVDGVSLHVDAGETLGIVGESGCGKSVTALSIMRLVPSPPGLIAGGEIRFRGRDLATLTEAEMQDVRGDSIAMIYQEPMTCLNPVHTIGKQISEALVRHRHLGREEARARAVELLRLVGIPLPEQRADAYPHQLSGGMRQRVMIAMALSCNPQLLIADEPTTALDVTVQAQILELLQRLQQEFGMATMLITHDLGVVAEMCERVVVMYAGRVVEEADVLSLFARPLHPYTEGLLASIPRLEGDRETLFAIPGSVPNPAARPPGCSFAARCSYAMDRCHTEDPPLERFAPGAKAACFLAAERFAASGGAR
jgi:oligopeptide/dipeptide ABC transporter ATP-binding protein